MFADTTCASEPQKCLKVLLSSVHQLESLRSVWILETKAVMIVLCTPPLLPTCMQTANSDKLVGHDSVLYV